MALFSFFKSTPHQRFKYIPRHWDPDEEKKAERKKYLDSLTDNSPEAIKKRLAKGGFKRGYTSDYEYRSKRVKKSNMTLIIILFAILGLLYYFINIYLPKIVESVEGSESMIN